ncbi:MAG: tetratricopeptide repeat protein [Acidovorax sp.]|uniref:tetratricopeptide repeat protein n=1 Tax=Acidovorax sp. TaxID=1872122 RepID=UPI0025B9DA5F|nr:tetratricopeptide repeat protein [Acidovorax sp.]MCE1193287.1 tetratricopeptide repeat protein [Acidovorax sp.]
MNIHYNLGFRPPQASQDQLAAWLEEAMQAHQQGQLARANQLYNTILKNDPRNVGALHMQGVLAYQAGHLQMAVDLIGQAIKHGPDDPAPHVNRALALGALQRHEEALAHFERAIVLRPDFAAAYVNRGITLKELGRLQEALASYDRALALEPQLAAAFNNKGNALRQLGRADEALECYRKAFALDPQDVDACQNMGVLLANAERPDEALRCFDQVIQMRPGHAEAHNAKGAILAGREQWEQAISHFETAIRSNDKLTNAHKNLGSAYRSLFQWDPAVRAFQRAAQLAPADADILSLLAFSLLDANKYQEAMDIYDRAKRLQPETPDSLLNRAGLHARFNRFQDAIADYQAAYDIKPEIRYLLGNIVHGKMKSCAWEGLGDMLKACESSLREGEMRVSPFIALSLFDDPALHLQVAKKEVETEYPPSSALGALKPRARGNKIRVGYYSADLHSHATAHLMAELFECHDRNRFEWVAFSFGPPAADPMRDRIAASFDRFVDVRELGGAEIARMSRDLGIDIGVDLKGFTLDNRFRIFSHRCAPIQVSYLGYPGTTGADYMDYVIADKVVVPPEAQAHFTEKVVYMPHSYQVNDSQRAISERVFTRSELGLPESGFVFCCFNNNYKIMPAVFDSWMRILHAVPGSVLWLFEDNPSVPENLRREAQARGIAGDRLAFAPRMASDLHLARHRLADLFLDTLPYNAHTTASDALWAGLPVLTRLGESFAARVAASLLHAVGLPELVTHSAAEYEALAIQLATNPAQLSALRGKLQTQKAQSPLFNGRQFARDLEAAYQAMQERHLQGLPPDVIEV